MGRTKAGWVAAAVALGFSLGATEAVAQSWVFDLGVGGGGVFPTKSLKSGDDVTLSEDAEASFKPGWLLGAQATLWPTARFGIRANLAYTERPFVRETDFPGRTDTDDLDADVLVDDVNIWSGTGDLLIRFTEPAETFEGSEFLPYLALGAGLTWVNPAVNRTRTIDGEEEEGMNFDAEPGESFFLAGKSGLTGLVGLGGDMRFSETAFLRLEVGDRILFDPPIYTDPPGEDPVGDLTHLLYGQAGLHIALGLRQPAQVVMAPPPARPPAAPAPPPPPPPAPRAVEVCVIDPGADNGVRVVQAMFRTEQRDTVVVEGGDTVAFSTTAPTGVTLAPDADWYVQGQPLVLTFPTAPRRVEFVTTGSQRRIPAGDLTLLGFQGDVPVFAASSDVAAIETQLGGMRAQMNDQEMSAVIGGNAEVRRAFNDVDIIYVPLQPTDCVFQALQRQEITLKK